MKNYLPKLTTSLMALMLLFSIGSLANDGHKDVVEVANLYELRQQEVGDGTVYLITGEVVLTHQNGNRNQKYFQDETAAILVDDASGIITTEYDDYDGVTGLIGTLSYYANMLQLVPAEDPGDATSTGNIVEPLEMTLDDLEPEHQAMLVIINGVLIDPGTHTNFAPSTSYTVTDESGEGVLRTPHVNAGLDYFNTPIPTTERDIISVINQFQETMQIMPRSLDDFLAVGEFSVTFNVIDENDEPIGDAVITFAGEELEPGQYLVENVAAGTHPYNVSREGYMSASGNLLVEDDVEIDIVLVWIDEENMITEFPWLEAFDHEEFPPAGWSHYALGDAGVWELADGQAYHNYTDQGEVADSWLVTPQVLLPEDEQMLMSFLERNQFMTDYGYSGVMISTGSGNPAHEQFVEVYESDTNIGIADPAETLVDLGAWAGELVYLAFVYQGEYAHRWWVDDVMIDYAPEAIEVPDISTLRQQPMGDLAYRITGEVVITHLQQAYRGQLYIQDETGAILIDDPGGVIETPYELYDGITNLTGKLTQFQDMLQLVPEEDPGEPTSHDNEMVPYEVTLADLNEDIQGWLVVVRGVSFYEDNPETFTHNESYYIYDDTADGEIRTPNSEGLLDYFGEPVPDTPKDLIGVLHQRFNVVRLQPRMLADFMDPDPSDVPLTEASGIKAYPNPANTSLTLESEGIQIEQVRIYSLSGQVVMQVNTASSDHIQLDVSGLNTGMYIIQAISGNDVRSLKLQITR